MSYAVGEFAFDFTAKLKAPRSCRSNNGVRVVRRINFHFVHVKRDLIWRQNILFRVGKIQARDSALTKSKLEPLLVIN